MRNFFIGIILGSALLGAVMQGSFLAFLLIVIGAEYVLFPAAIFLLVIASIQRWTGRAKASWFNQAIGAWFTIALGLAVSWTLGRAINWYEVTSVHAYVAKAVPLLEQIHSQTGTYPTTLPVMQLGSPPILLRESDAYTSDGKGFHFQYSNPAEFVGEGEQFDSSSRSWTRFDPMG